MEAHRTECSFAETIHQPFVEKTRLLPTALALACKTLEEAAAVAGADAPDVVAALVPHGTYAPAVSSLPNPSATAPLTRM